VGSRTTLAAGRFCCRSARGGETASLAGPGGGTQGDAARGRGQGGGQCLCWIAAAAGGVEAGGGRDVCMNHAIMQDFIGREPKFVPPIGEVCHDLGDLFLPRVVDAGQQAPQRSPGAAFPQVHGIAHMQGVVGRIGIGPAAVPEIGIAGPGLAERDGRTQLGIGPGQVMAGATGCREG
jgi:hypothetical protein